ncbi:putative phosphatidylglycerophosphatase B [Vibrio chagasii]|uniref:phosphatase PAP2 family protein n=1 Tax=Vibrio sp. 99K-1 TaxID=2607603 RepID=UPI001493AA20|nr:phosphatase PAP2 family protein [Vibrio sp. 99K-1]CAH6838886.1 putative phosphatidylglycerophosphatase B [Vibrio chagasii]NOI87139.1 phosphatase PAP2 family protein [Vibrio sp. 99K-1]CAH6842611.1 putative phosphatidylglycerophosphatase B [Vibrio chagasii]CAH6878618.1 putative phosphatidylglycerophosphatase B [Vibrio chagasii]CAH6882976.1 putative phosphatidylglycerophosphatase B [Vibrio chagasii]
MTSLFSNKSKGLLLLVLSLYSLVPFLIFGSHFDLGSAVLPFYGAVMTFVTYSAGNQGFLITLAILSLLVLTLKFSKAKLVSLCLQLGILLVLSFAAKTFLKSSTESPRPYTEYLVTQEVVDMPELFYELPLEEKNVAIESVEDKVSDWRTRHWLGETDYSFPSGHMIFVGVCLAFFGGLFLEAKRFYLVGGMLAWAGGVAYSRVWLGMHRPEDLAASIAFAGLIYLLVPLVPTQKIEPLLPKFLRTD